MSPRKPSTLSSRKSAPRTPVPAGSALLGAATLVASATVGLVLPTGHAIYCDRVAPLAVLAAMAAVLIALCFRVLSGPLSSHRRLAPASLALAAMALFLAAGFIKHTYSACGEVEERLKSLKGLHSALPTPTPQSLVRDRLQQGRWEKVNNGPPL